MYISNAKVSKEKAQMERHTMNVVHDKHISSGHWQMLSDTKTKSIQHVHQTAFARSNSNCPAKENIISQQSLVNPKDFVQAPTTKPSH